MIEFLPITIMVVALAVGTQHLVARRATSHQTVAVVVRPRREALS